jgi:hypothetical protein
MKRLGCEVVMTEGRITLRCPDCQMRWAVADHRSGTNCECPDCGRIVPVQESTPAPWEEPSRLGLRPDEWPLVLVFVPGVMLILAPAALLLLGLIAFAIIWLVGK